MKKGVLVGVLFGLLLMGTVIGTQYVLNRSKEDNVVSREELDPRFIKRVIIYDTVEYEGPMNIRKDVIQAGPTPDSYKEYNIADFNMKYKTVEIYQEGIEFTGEGIESLDDYKIIEGTEEEHEALVVKREIDGEWVIDDTSNIKTGNEEGMFGDN